MGVCSLQLPDGPTTGVDPHRSAHNGRTAGPVVITQTG
jgi:hypothetical protein